MWYQTNDKCVKCFFFIYFANCIQIYHILKRFLRYKEFLVLLAKTKDRYLPSLSINNICWDHKLQTNSSFVLVLWLGCNIRIHLLATLKEDWHGKKKLMAIYLNVIMFLNKFKKMTIYLFFFLHCSLYLIALRWWWNFAVQV